MKSKERIHTFHLSFYYILSSDILYLYLNGSIDKKGKNTKIKFVNFLHRLYVVTKNINFLHLYNNKSIVLHHTYTAFTTPIIHTEKSSRCFKGLSMNDKIFIHLRSYIIINIWL